MTEAVVAVAQPTIATLIKSGQVFLDTHQIESARLEAQYLLASVLGCDRLRLVVDANQTVGDLAHRNYRDALHRRAAHEPLQYITGEVEFWGLSFSVSPGVFIPRPETELIVEAALALSIPPQQILDLCTGSGTLAVSLAHVFPESSVVATDLSDIALEVAAKNASKQGCEAQLRFLKGDLFEAFDGMADSLPRFDLIVSNPPYIAESERESLPTEVRDHEPDLALFAQEEGLLFYRRILNEAPALLNPGGLIFLELGQGQSDWLRDFVAEEINHTHQILSLSFIRDWAGIERIAKLELCPDLRQDGPHG